MSTRRVVTAALTATAAAALVAALTVPSAPATRGEPAGRCHGLAVTLAGATPAADQIFGTPGADVVDGLGGDDRIYGMGGDDVLCGGAGDDAVHGDAGDDTVVGGDGDDLLHGNDGDDVLAGSAGSDRVHGDAGDDLLRSGGGRASSDDRSPSQLFGGDGDDVLDGGAGRDGLQGGAGDDLLRGGAGADSLSDTDGHDRLQGGPGDDVLRARDASPLRPAGDRLDGAPGRDTCLRDAGDAAAGCERLPPRRERGTPAARPPGGRTGGCRTGGCRIGGCRIGGGRSSAPAVEEDLVGIASPDVERYLDALEHPLKAGVLRLRAAVLGCDPDLTEHVKWNAPSFCRDGVDRVTFRLHPRGKLQLVLHRGAAVRDDTAGFAFEDPSGLLTWLSPDRAVLDFPDEAAVAAREAAVVALVRRWVLT